MRIPPTMHWHPLPAALDVGTHATIPTKLVDVTAENAGGLPCRKCLTNGQLGQKMLLLSYDPFLGDSPYRQHGPIFVHSEPKCELAEFPTGVEVDVPEQQRKWDRLAVRAFDEKHMMIGFDVVAGKDLVERAERFFSETESEYLHVHYAAPGCFAVRIDKVLH